MLMQPDGRISNLYYLKVLNKSHKQLPIRFELIEPAGELRMVGKPLDLETGALGQSELFVVLSTSALDGMKTKVVIGVYTGDRLLEKVKTSFVGPMKPPGA